MFEQIDVLVPNAFTSQRPRLARARWWEASFRPGAVDEGVGFGRGERARPSATRQIGGCRVTVGGQQGPVDLILTA